MFGTIMYVPFYVQGVLGRSATTAGLVEMVMTIAMVTCSAIAGQIITKTGKYKLMGIAGIGIMATGIFMNSTLTQEAPLSGILVNLIITGVGLGMTMPIFTLTVQNAVDHRYLGVATSTSQLFRMTGGTIGVSVMGYIMTAKMSEKLTLSGPPPIPQEVLDVDITPQSLLDANALDITRATIPGPLQPNFDLWILSLKEALNYSLTQVFLVSAIIVMGALVLTLFLKEIPLRTSNNTPTVSGGDTAKIG